MNKLRIRLVVDILMAVCVLQGWWIPALVLGIVGAWTFQDYLEIVVAGVGYEGLFGDMVGANWKSHEGLIVSVAILLIIVGLKKVVRR